MSIHHRLLFTALAAALCASAAHAGGAGGGAAAEVKPLVLKPRGSDGTAPFGSMERLRQRLEEKLGATPDPEGDRVIRVVNRLPAKEAAVKKPSGVAKEQPSATRGHGELLASAAMSGGQGAIESAAGVPPKPRPMAPWDYHGAGAPHKWGNLDPAYNTCSTGQRQSPINIRDGIKVELEPLKFDYKPTGFSVIDDGHTVQVDVQPGNFVSVMGRRYELVEFHFHRPAEEVVEGKRYEMVVHMLHRDAEGRLAMVAVLLDRGSSQPVIQTIWNNLPLEKGEALAAPAQIDIAQLLPADQAYFTYMGSLTTPPCTEGVLWMVLRQPVQVSEEQIDIFSRLYPMNARPLQAASGRLIKQN